MKQRDFWSKLTRNAPDGNPGAQGGAPDPVADPAPDFGFVPADFQADGKPDWTRFGAHYQDLVSTNAQIAERMANVPADGAYDWTLPQDFKLEGLDLPEGYTPRIAADDETLRPIFAELGATLKEFGVPKEGSAKLMGMLARYEATRQSQAYTAAKAELGALGTPDQQTARMAAVERALDAKLPADQAKALKAVMHTAGAIKALEALVGPRPSTGTTPSPQPNTGADENLTAEQRLERANQRFFETGARRRTA